MRVLIRARRVFVAILTFSNLIFSIPVETHKFVQVEPTEELSPGSPLLPEQSNNSLSIILSTTCFPPYSSRPILDHGACRDAISEFRYLSRDTRAWQLNRLFTRMEPGISWLKCPWSYTTQGCKLTIDYEGESGIFDISIGKDIFISAAELLDKECVAREGSGQQLHRWGGDVQFPAPVEGLILSFTGP